MDITLPPLHDAPGVHIQNDSRSLVVVGANGAGKSRFTSWMTNNLSGSSVRISALKALYQASDHDTLPGSIDSDYERAVADSRLLNPDCPTRLERLLALLLHEEMITLLDYKLHIRDGAKPRMRKTSLDGVINLWEDLFPGNKVLIEGGKMLFANSTDDEAIASVRLSDGEKAVLYYAGATLRAMGGATIFVENPSSLLHPALAVRLWNRLEDMRPDATFVYTTHDLDFASSRQNATIIWVKDYDAADTTWDYSILPARSGLPDEIYFAILGDRRPVLFIEGDDTHSIDSKLYPLIFPSHTVKPLGSCNKVIEAVRSFNSLESFHHLDSWGIVDRDRRDAGEVEYLRRKRILVPAVAEVENLLMLEEIVRTVASSAGKDEEKVFRKVKNAVIHTFEGELRQQAMLHTRHRVKRTVEYRVDGRFNSISDLEEHVRGLMDQINPRGLYEGFCREFRRYVAEEDYASILMVYNRKTMISFSNVASLCGVQGNKNGYVGAILDILRRGGNKADRIRRAVTRSFGLGPSGLIPEATSGTTIQSGINIQEDEEDI